MQFRIVGFASLLFCGVWITEQANAAESSTEGTKYEHRPEVSRFDLGAGAHRETDGSYERIIGDKGVFMTDRVTGAILAVPNASVVPKPPAPADRSSVTAGETQPIIYSPPLTDKPDEHSAAVRKYLVTAGVPEAEVGGTHVTATMAGGGPVRGGVQPSRSRLLWYTTHLERSLGGIPVEGSYAFAALGSAGQVITEGVYWPAIPARIVQRAEAFKQRLDSASGRADFLAAARRQQPLVGDAAGTIKIVHTSGEYHGEFGARALYVVVVPSPNGGKAKILRFDDEGTPVRMADELPSGIDSEKQR